MLAAETTGSRMCADDGETMTAIENVKRNFEILVRGVGNSLSLPSVVQDTSFTLLYDRKVQNTHFDVVKFNTIRNTISFFVHGSWQIRKIR